ncbi:MAG TPA: DUF5666 domain-containing protein [Thermoanaerobaculia bacterium]|nr:DUF5666 domain-containing protein [Thermoanaerobaculia bacterium]
MSTFLRIPRSIAFRLGALAALALTASCHESSSSPTAMGSATVLGTVILGAGTSGATTQGMEIGLSGVTVRVVQGGPSAVTDASGNFTLNGVPAGTVDMEFARSDINARAPVVLASGTNQITAAVHGSKAVITPRGHAGEEIEGLVQSTNAGGSSLVVLDQRLGAVTVKTDSSTLIRRGNTVIPLSQIQTGMRVHVKAMLQGDGSYLATEVLLQDENIGGEREVQGSVASVDTGAKSFVVTTVSGPITVKTGDSTTFKKKGTTASFSDVVAGAMVEAEGALQADGSILARKVTIE